MGKVRQFSNEDPRNRTGKDIKVGMVVHGQFVTHVKSERRGGKMGFRIRLKDKRAAWVSPNTRVIDVKFEHVGRRATA